MTHDLLRTVKDLEEIEKTPVENRLSAESTYDLLRSSAARFGDKLALTYLPTGTVSDEARTYSYRTFFEEVTKAANLFNAHGARPGRAVSLLMPNLPETHFCLWGAQAAAIANPINPMLNIDEVVAIMEAAETTHLVAPGPNVDSVLWSKACEAQTRMGRKLKLIIVDDATDLEMSDGAVSYHAGIGVCDGASLDTARVLKPNDIAAYFHTGGTTGTPKLAQHTHRNEVADAWMAGYSFGFREGDVTLTGLPLFHANAAIISGIGALSSGVHVLLAGKDGFRNKETISDFWRLVDRYKVTNFSAVPTIYAALMDVPKESADLSTLRFCICGAAPMPTSLFRQFEEQTGVTILEAYGMTESTCVSTCNPRDGDKRLGSIGIRLPYQEIKVACVDDNGDFIRDAEIDETGVLCLKGPNVIPGYKQAEANLDLWLEPGWLNTGDLARIDKDGYVWLTGRAKDLIIRGGHNIDPQMIEDTLCRHPMVEIAAAIGKPDAYAGEVPIAYVALKEKGGVSSNELMAFAREHVAERPAAPSEVIILDKLPVTAVGKLFKPALRIDAVGRVARGVLEQYRLEKDIEVANEKGTGIVVSVLLSPDEKQRSDEIENALGRFAFTVRVIEA